MISFTEAINVLVNEKHPDCGWGYIGDIDNLKDLTGLTVGNNETVNFNYDDVVAKKTELENAEPMKALREERNRKLAQTDWRASSDLTLGKWATYRQALRDLPSKATPTLDEDGNLQNVTWPDEPT